MSDELTKRRLALAEKQKLFQIESFELEKDLLRADLEERIKKIDQQIEKLKK